MTRQFHPVSEVVDKKGIQPTHTRLAVLHSQRQPQCLSIGPAARSVDITLNVVLLANLVLPEPHFVESHTEGNIDIILSNEFGGRRFAMLIFHAEVHEGLACGHR